MCMNCAFLLLQIDTWFILTTLCYHIYSHLVQTVKELLTQTKGLRHSLKWNSRFVSFKDYKSAIDSSLRTSELKCIVCILKQHVNIVLFSMKFSVQNVINECFQTVTHSSSCSAWIWCSTMFYIVSTVHWIYQSLFIMNHHSLIHFTIVDKTQSTILTWFLFCGIFPFFMQK